MEENITNNKNNKVLIIILVILIFLVGGLGFYLGGVFQKNDEKVTNNTNNSSKQEENNKKEENTPQTDVDTTNEKDNFKIISQKDTSKLSSGDQVKLNTEEFYVVSSNENETVLLSKYNLYVGNIIEYVENDGIVDSWMDNYKFIKTISKDDTKYGLQSSEAKGSAEKTNQAIGVVEFSGDTYWLKNEKLLKKYKADNIYNISLSKEEMTMNSSNLSIKNQKYTIAYFVEEYANTLKQYTDSSIKGRLLLVSELNKLGCKLSLEEQGGRCDDAPDWLFTSTYWLGSFAGGSDRVGYFVASIGWNENKNETDEEDEQNIIFDDDYNDALHTGVRPVIVVKTSDIK